MKNLYKYFTPIIAECNTGNLIKKEVYLGGWIIYNSVLKKKKFENNCIIIEKNLFENNLYQGYKYLYNICSKTQNPLILGGDHSISSSTLLSSLNKYRDNLTVIWIDSRPNILTMKSSFNKNSNETALAMVLGHENEIHRDIINKYNNLCDSIVDIKRDGNYILQKDNQEILSDYFLYENYNWTKYIINFLSSNNLIFCGIRDYGLYENKIISHFNIRNLSPDEVIDFITKTENKIHISFDVSALDPYLLNSTSFTSTCGLDIHDVSSIITKSIETKKLIGLDIVEFNPNIGNLNKSVEVLKNIFEISEKN